MSEPEGTQAVDFSHYVTGLAVFLGTSLVLALSAHRLLLWQAKRKTALSADQQK